MARRGSRLSLPRLTVFLLAVAAFSSACAFRISDALLPAVAADFDSDVGAVSTVVTMFAVGYGLAQFVYGPLGDRFDKFRVIRAATVMCSLASLGAAIAPDLRSLEACRLLAGMAGAGIIPLGMAWIGDHVPYQDRQALLARFTVGSISGLAAGQAMGGIIAATLGWREAFACLAVLYLAVAAVMFRHAPEPDEQGSQAGRSFLSPLVVVLRTALARRLLLFAFFEGAVVFGCFAFIPSLLQQRFGVSMMLSGLTGSLFALGGVAYAGAAKRLLSLLGQKGVMLLGGLLLGAALAAFSLAGAAWWAVPASFTLGLGYYFVHGTLQSLATQLAPTARGTAVSLFAAFFFCGQSFGVWALARAVSFARMDFYLFLFACATPITVLVFSRLLRLSRIG
jgi:predicted MFS family arabinose efflux permease